MENDSAAPSAFLRLLEGTVRTGKPPLFWLGAGVSAWNGYPLWKQLAENFHSRYVEVEPSYDRLAARHAIDAGAYPQFFSISWDSRRQAF